MKLELRSRRAERVAASYGWISRIAGIIVLALAAQALLAEPPQPAPHVRVGVPSDWTHQHVFYPETKSESLKARLEKDPRWVHDWYLHHREVWWPEAPRGRGKSNKGEKRDWNIPLSATPATSSFEPLFNFTFGIGPDSGYGALNSTDLGGGEYLATAGTLTVTGGQDVGAYSLSPGGPGNTPSPSGYFSIDNVLYPSIDPAIDNQGLLFTANTFEVNIFSNGPDNFQFYDNTGYNNTGAPFTLTAAPGGGQTFPAKYAFDVTAAPSCTSDYVVIGIPTTPAAGGQANIVGVNNLYSSQGGSSSADCGTNGPTVMFAYASGTGQVPASVTLSGDGSQVAYVENRLTGSSYFHALTLGTTGTNGTSATSAVVPGAAGGNNAVDQAVLLSPDGGITNQSSTTAPFIVYEPYGYSDVAYVTTYSVAGSGSGYLYKIGNVFNGSVAPTILWSVAIDAIPSAPVYDYGTNQVFFTDSEGRIDYVTDTGSTPSVVYTAVLAGGNTAENPVMIDLTNQMVYAFFNSNGTNAVVVQAPANMSSDVSIPVGLLNLINSGPYGAQFNNAWYTGSGTPMLYVAGTGLGTLPTLYGIGFGGGGILNINDVTITPLALGTADASPVTEFYNATLGRDYLFLGVTNNCIAALLGGGGGCAMSLDITNGFPTVNSSTIALPASGGTSGIIIDNDSSVNGASSVYYATKTGVTLVKATQSGLN